MWFNNRKILCFKSFNYLHKILSTHNSQCCPAVLSTLIWWCLKLCIMEDDLSRRFIQGYTTHLSRSLLSCTKKWCLPYYSLSSEDFSATWHLNNLIALLEKIDFIFYHYFSYENCEESPKAIYKHDFLYE